jgi:hypothetical protein
MAYITGEASDLEAFDIQARAIHEQWRRAVFVGSIGRAALYGHFEWQMEPLPLRRSTHELRDFDLLLAGRLKNNSLCGSPHSLGRDMDEYVHMQHRASVAELCGEDENGYFALEAPKELFAARTRRLGATPIRTLRIGVHQQIERIAHPIAGYEDPKYDVSRAEFDTFAEAMRPLHPNEFPSDEQLAPLVELVTRNIQ